MFDERCYRENSMQFMEDEGLSYIPQENLRDFINSSGCYSPYPICHGNGEYENRYTTPNYSKSYEYALYEFRSCAHNIISKILENRAAEKYLSIRNERLQRLWKSFDQIPDDLIFKRPIDTEDISDPDKLLSYITDAVNVTCMYMEFGDFETETKDSRHKIGKTLWWKTIKDDNCAFLILAYIELLIRHYHIDKFKLGIYDYRQAVKRFRQFVYVENPGDIVKLYNKLNDLDTYEPIMIVLSASETDMMTLRDDYKNWPYYKEQKQLNKHFSVSSATKAYSTNKRICDKFTEMIVGRHMNDIFNAAISMRNPDFRCRYFNTLIKNELVSMKF